MITSAKISQINYILNITNACRIYMESHGIYQWTPNYPSNDAFEKDIARNELYVLWLNKKIIGCITISTLIDEEYMAVKWLGNNAKSVYIHRLAVHPTYQGQGYAQKLMDFAENYARQKGAFSVRLDTFSQNTRNKRFYQQRGYIQLEDIFFPNQSQFPFHCYELVL